MIIKTKIIYSYNRKMLMAIYLFIVAAFAYLLQICS